MILQGYIDCDVNEAGKEQISLLAKRFSQIPLDAVYSSPLKRAVKTAQGIANTQNLEVTTVDSLIELNCGIYEGKTYSEISKINPDFADIWANHPQDFAPLNGEPMVDAYERIYKAVTTLALQNSGKTIACVTHGGVLRCLLCKLLYNDINKLSTVSFGSNTAVTLLECDDDGSIKIAYMNDSTHLPESLDKVKIPTGV